MTRGSRSDLDLTGVKIPWRWALRIRTPICRYGTDLGRTMRTTDGGASWHAVYSRESSKAGWTTTGLDVTTTYGYHFDPFDHQRQFITTTDIGFSGAKTAENPG